MNIMVGSKAERFAHKALVAGALAAFGILGPSETAAQSSTRPSLTVSAGIAEYDLSGTGTTGMAAIGVSFPITTFLSVDPELAFMRYEPQLTSHTTFLLPEVGARLQIPGRVVNPFITVGGGWAAVVAGPGDSDFTLHTAVGTYVWLGNAWAIRPEARLRSFDPFVGTTADVTIGVSRRL